MSQIKKVFKALVLVVMIFSFVFSAIAEDGQGESNGQQQQPNDNSINNNANVGKSNSSSASKINTVIGVGMIAYGTYLLAQQPSNPYGAVLIAMGGMALAQAGADSGAAGAYGNVEGLTGTTLPGWTGVGVGGGDEGGGDGLTSAGFGNLGPDGLAALKKAEDLGFKFDANKGVVTDPDGKEIPFASINSGSAAGSGASGFTSGNLDAGKKYANKLAKEAADKYSVGTMGFAGAGGGGGGSHAGAAGAANDPFSDYLKSLNKKKKPSRKPASVAGMKKPFGSDVIGVRADNIFEMIHRRYKQKRDNKEFIEGPVGRGL